MQEPSRPPAIFQKVIVATDFSEFAAVALLRAANLALRFQASIVIAYVIDPISSAAGSEGVPFVEQEDEHSALQKLEAASLCLRECGIPYSLAVRKGDIRDELSRLVEEEQADLLVLSTHGQYRFDRPVCSSIAEKILRMAPCPVMTVGPAARLTRDAAYNSNHILFLPIFPQSHCVCSHLWTHSHPCWAPNSRCCACCPMRWSSIPAMVRWPD